MKNNDFRNAVCRGLWASGHPLPEEGFLVKVKEATQRCRATGLPVYAVFVKGHNAKRGTQVAEFIWLS